VASALGGLIFTWGKSNSVMFGLRRMGVDLESKKITASHVLYRGRLLRGLKKHKRARKPRQHQVLIPEMLEVVLRDHMESSPFQGPEDFLFHKSDGSPSIPTFSETNCSIRLCGNWGFRLSGGGAAFTCSVTRRHR
jgi:hypothetical protein